MSHLSSFEAVYSSANYVMLQRGPFYCIRFLKIPTYSVLCPAGLVYRFQLNNSPIKLFHARFIYPLKVMDLSESKLFYEILKHSQGWKFVKVLQVLLIILYGCIIIVIFSLLGWNDSTLFEYPSNLWVVWN